MPLTRGTDILGFFFLYKRTFSEFQACHIYLAAIHLSARGQGVFPLLLEEAKCKAMDADVKILSVATVPKRFPRMYSILNRPGSGWETVQWKEASEGVQTKVYMSMKLGLESPT